MEQCQAKCDQLSCDCFDFTDGTPPGHSVIGTGISGSGPIVIFEPTLQTSLVLSAASNFMVASQIVTNNTLAYGIMGSILNVPQGFTVDTIVTLSSGVNTAMDDWGVSQHGNGMLRALCMHAPKRAFTIACKRVCEHEAGTQANSLSHCGPLCLHRVSSQA